MYWIILRMQGKLYWKISSFKKKEMLFFENNHINIHLHYCKAIHGIINELLVIYIHAAALQRHNIEPRLF